MSRAFVLLLAAYLSLAGGYALLVPLWEAPDEPAHFLYAHHIAETGAPPPAPPPQRGRFFEHGFVVSAYEWHQMPLYYGLAAPLLQFNRAVQWLPIFSGFPDINPDFPHAVRLFEPHAWAFTELHLLRLFSVLLGACTLVVIGWTAHRLFPDREQAHLPILAAGLVAFIPQYTFLHAYITNDALAIFLSALGLAALVNVTLVSGVTPTTSPSLPGHVGHAVSGRGHLRRAWVWAGLATSAALVAKMTAWFLAPLAGLLWLALWRQGQRRGRAALVDLSVYLASAAILPLIVGLLWPDIIDRLAHSPQASSIRPEFLSLAYLAGLLPTTHASFWGVFGWMNVATPDLLRRVFDGLWLIGLAGASYGLVRHRHALDTRQRLALGLLGVASMVVVVQFFAFNLTVTQPQGRFLYPAILGPAILAAWGWLWLASRRRGAATLILLGGLFLLNLMSLLFILRPAYA